MILLWVLFVLNKAIKKIKIYEVKNAIVLIICTKDSLIINQQFQKMAISKKNKIQESKKDY